MITEKTVSKAIYSVYQPIIQLEDQAIIGYEALTRGQGVGRYPQELFRRAYMDGMVISLDFECLLSAIKVLPILGNGHLLFLNVEPMTLARSFRAKHDGEFFLKKFAKYAENIVFELTEGMKMSDFAYVKHAVTFLRRMGFRFALDDVADVGYKVLKLISLKPDFIKLDMSLVHGLREDRMHLLLIKRLTEEARACHARVVAEGVESEDEIEPLRKMGIEYAQGFYFGRPKKTLQRKPSNL
ncbi:MAG: EAL domain-containing protein [Candidatus Omnitrophota bacterium]|nr:EAL domain-containing protein [Candidatus Omnitrophota bacterium]